jgi:hypothetical protein
MSVHGEYARALRMLIVRLEEYEALAEGKAAWTARFQGAVVEESRDLSTAARTADALLDALDRELGDDPEGASVGRPDLPGARGGLGPLRDACANLRAHCRAILGVRPGGG